MRYRPSRSTKERVIAEWRGYWEEQDTSQFENKIGDLLPALMKTLGLKERFQEEMIFEAWHSMVDNFMASNARPVALQGRTLIIQVLHAAVHYELDRMKGQLLARMQERFGKDRIREVRFRLG